MRWIYDSDNYFFSVKNIFFIRFFVVGVFFRYIYILIRPELFGSFLIISDLKSDAYYHTITAILIFVFISSYYIGSRNYKIGKISLRYPYKKRYYDALDINNKYFIVVYYILLIIYVVYSFLNIRIATEHTYGTFDNFINIIGTIVRLMAYIYLCIFLDKKK